MCPLIEPDFSEVTGAIPPGTYAARIKDCEVKDSQKGQKYLNWKLELFGDPEVNNRIVEANTMIAGKGAFKLKELYKAAMGEDLDGKFDTDSLIGREITVALVQGKDREGNPSQFPDVKSFAPLKQ